MSHIKIGNQGYILKNEYVRTKNGCIGKVKKTIFNLVITDNGIFKGNEIKKSKLDIRSLLEDGDYVNGFKLINNKIIITTSIFNLWELEIEDIVTHEQFEAMSYEI